MAGNVGSARFDFFFLELVLEGGWEGFEGEEREEDDDETWRRICRPRRAGSVVGDILFGVAIVLG